MSTCPLPPFLTSATWGPQDSARVSGASSAFASSATGFGGGKEFNRVDPSAVQFSSVRFGSVLFGSVQLSSVRFGLVQLSLVRFGSVRFSSIQLSSVLDGIYALGKAHVRSIQALRNLLTKAVATRDNYVRPRPVQMPKTASP